MLLIHLIDRYRAAKFIGITSGYQARCIPTKSERSIKIRLLINIEYDNNAVVTRTLFPRRR